MFGFSDKGVLARSTVDRGVYTIYRKTAKDACLVRCIYCACSLSSVCANVGIQARRKWPADSAVAHRTGLADAAAQCMDRMSGCIWVAHHSCHTPLPLPLVSPSPSPLPNVATAALLSWFRFSKIGPASEVISTPFQASLHGASSASRTQSAYPWFLSVFAWESCCLVRSPSPSFPSDFGSTLLPPFKW